MPARASGSTSTSAARRSFIGASIERGLQWAVVEPNDEPLWATVRASVADFLTSLWRDGTLVGSGPQESFFVRCDRSTMTQADIDAGRLVVMVASRRSGPPSS